MCKQSAKLAFILLLIASLVVFPLLSGCGDKDNDEGTHEVTIGIMLDFSGTASGAGRRNAQLWEDSIQYTNEYDPIPGIKLKVIPYDNQYDPGRTMTGYVSLLNQGVELILGMYPHDGEILKDRLAEDKVVMYLGSISESILDPPGWIFALGSAMRNYMELFLQWLSTEGWDYQEMGRKPKISVFGWDDPLTWERVYWIKQWIQAHPDEFEWITEEVASYGNMAWVREATRLKDADYLIVGTHGPGVTTFVNQAKSVGCDAKYVVCWAQVAFWDTFVESCGADTLAGAVFVNESTFYWEDTAPSQYIRTVLEAIDPDMLTDTLNVVVNGVRMPIEAIRAAAEEVGPENVDGEAIYEALLNIHFPPELLGHPEGSGYSTDRPPALQRCGRPSARIYGYNPEAEYGWELVANWTTFPQWVGVTV